jgi:arginine N-succinyltransferase
MLEAEGFVYDGSVDIFDAGPTLHARIDQLKSIVESRNVDGGLELSLSGSKRYLRAENRGLDFSVRVKTV